MDQNIQQQLTGIRKSMANASQSLEQLWQHYPMLWQELGWDQAQLRLWLGCLPDIEVTDADKPNPVYGFQGKADSGDDLGDVIVKVLETVDRPMPVKQVMSKLPAGMIVTEPMMWTAIKGHPRLMQAGPLVKLA